MSDSIESNDQRVRPFRSVSGQAAACVVLGLGAGVCIGACLLKLQEWLVPIADWNHLRPYVFWAFLVPILSYVAADVMWRIRRLVPRVVLLGLAVTELGYLGWWLSHKFSLQFVILDTGVLRLARCCEIGIVSALIVWLFSLPRDLYRHYVAQTELTRTTVNRTLGYLAALSIGTGLAFDYLARMVQLGTAPWGLGGGALCGLIMIPVVQGLETDKSIKAERPQFKWPSAGELVFAMGLGAAAGLCLHVLFLVMTRSIAYRVVSTPLAACIAIYALCITGACIACLTQRLFPRGTGIRLVIAEVLWAVIWWAAHGFSIQRSTQSALFWQISGWVGAAGILVGGHIYLKRSRAANGAPV